MRWGIRLILLTCLSATFLGGTVYAKGQGSVTGRYCAAKSVGSKAMGAAADIVKVRARQGFGWKIFSVTKVGKSCFSVSAPRAARHALAKLAGRGRLILGDSNTKSSPPLAGAIVRLTSGRAKPQSDPPLVRVVVWTGEIVSGSAKIVATEGGGPALTFNMTKSGSSAFCRYTSTHIDYFSPVVLDRHVLADPQIMAGICGGETEVSGISRAEAKLVRADLMGGVIAFRLRFHPS